MNIGILLRDPFLKWVEMIHEELDKRGYEEIRPAHGNVFQFIGKAGARITTMAERAQMTKQSMSYLVDYLEQRGYVERKEDEADRRAVIFCLTKKGWDCVAEVEDIMKGLEKKWRQQLGKKQYDELFNNLLALREIL